MISILGGIATPFMLCCLCFVLLSCSMSSAQTIPALRDIICWPMCIPCNICKGGKIF